MKHSPINPHMRSSTKTFLVFAICSFVISTFLFDSFSSSLDKALNLTSANKDGKSNVSKQTNLEKFESSIKPGAVVAAPGDLQINVGNQGASCSNDSVLRVGSGGKVQCIDFDSAFTGKTPRFTGLGVGLSGSPHANFKLQVKGTTGAWYGGAAFGNDSANVVIGELSGKANIGAHNAALNNWANLHLQRDGGNVQIGGGNDAAANSLLRVEGDVAGQVFKDIENFAYVVNPAGSSNIVSMTMGGNLTFGNYGLGHVGTYSDVRYQNVFSMGPAYVTSADGTSLSNHYGIAWTHSNIGGQSKAGLSHQALFTIAGVTQTAIGSGIWTNGVTNSVGGFQWNGQSLDDRYRRFGVWQNGHHSATNGDEYASIYRDTENGGYYVDPSNVSNIASSIYMATNGWTGGAGVSQGKLQYHADRWYINAGSNSARVVQFRRGEQDLAWIDNSGQFYPSGQDSYYLQSANSGLWSNGNLGASGDLYLGTRGTWLSSWLNQGLQTGHGPTFTNIYNNGWFRNQNALEGLYSTPYGNHWYPENGNIWTVGGNGGGSASIRFRNTHQGTYYGRVYGDASGVGFLWTDDAWSLRVAGGDVYVSRGTVYAGNYVQTLTANGNIRMGELWGEGGLYRPASQLVFGTEGNNHFGFRSGNVQRAVINGSDGDLWMGWCGCWNSTNPSDSRLKKDVKALSSQDTLNKVLKLKGITFKWNEKKAVDSKTHYGYIAQEVLPLFPEIITKKNLDPNGKDKTEYLNIDYEKLVPVLSEAIKGLNEKIEKVIASVQKLMANDSKQDKLIEAQSKEIELLKKEIKALKEAR